MAPFGAATTYYVYDWAGSLMAVYGRSANTVSGTRYVTVDHLGSTRVTMDASGAVKMRCDYTPFGEQIAAVAAQGNRNLIAEYACSEAAPTQKFTGKERGDAGSENSLDYFGARYFSGAQGRFTSPDEPFADQTAVDPQSWNLYGYVRNNPLTFVDLNGRNYSMCATYGDCVDMTDAQYEEWRKRMGNSIIVRPGGDILNHETEQKIGSAQRYDLSGLESLKRAGHSASPVADIRGIGLFYGASALDGRALYGAGALGGGLITLELGAGAGTGVAPTAGQVAAVSRTAAQGGRKVVEKTIRNVGGLIAAAEKWLRNNP